MERLRREAARRESAMSELVELRFVSFLPGPGAGLRPCLSCPASMATAVLGRGSHSVGPPTSCASSTGNAGGCANRGGATAWPPRNSWAAGSRKRSAVRSCHRARSHPERYPATVRVHGRVQRNVQPLCRCTVAFKKMSWRCGGAPWSGIKMPRRCARAPWLGIEMPGTVPAHHERPSKWFGIVQREGAVPNGCR